MTDVEDIFVSDAVVSGFSVARLVFASDGKIFMSIGMPLRDEAHGGSNRIGTAEQSQDPGSHAGKILRLNDDGTAPSDNPFAGDPAYRPEIYALGFRDPLGLIVHPETGELWEVEHGPQGGDELNIVRPGRNYGWPVVSYGRAYTGEATVGTGGTGPELSEPCAPGMEQPLLYWYPVISPGGMALYTGDAFPAWKGSLFIGGMSTTQLQLTSCYGMTSCQHSCVRQHLWPPERRIPSAISPRVGRRDDERSKVASTTSHAAIR